MDSSVVDEAALRRPIGEPGVMHRQLHHLLGAAGRPHVTLRVVPLTAGAHAGLRGAFVILEFAEEPALVFVKNHATGLFLEEEDAELIAQIAAELG